MSQTDSFQIFRERLRWRIRALRHECGYSQEQLGELIGLDRVSIGYIEQGRRTPSLQTLFNLAIAFGIDISDLFDC
ncbi:MAG: helix-turn-helix transcriptional regulator [Coriobacteriales bacterium]|jgi:DNA-binding XRE family transcriptional regulator|nr:helix-turn-helix transcriptional regulator [Coriobacteriales bacterium]